MVAASPNDAYFDANAWVYSEPWGDGPFDAGFIPLDEALFLTRRALTRWKMSGQS